MSLWWSVLPKPSPALNPSPAAFKATEVQRKLKAWQFLRVSQVSLIRHIQQRMEHQRKDPPQSSWIICHRWSTWSAIMPYSWCLVSTIPRYNHYAITNNSTIPTMPYSLVQPLCNTLVGYTLGPVTWLPTLQLPQAPSGCQGTTLYTESSKNSRAAHVGESWHNSLWLSSINLSLVMISPWS